MANSEEVASWVYRERRNVGSSVFEEVLSNSSSALPRDEDEIKVITGSV